MHRRGDRKHKVFCLRAHLQLSVQKDVALFRAYTVVASRFGCVKGLNGLCSPHVFLDGPPHGRDFAF